MAHVMDKSYLLRTSWINHYFLETVGSIIPECCFLWEGLFLSHKNMMRCPIWYHLHYLQNMKNTHGEVLLLVKPSTSLKATLLKVTLPHECFSRF